MVHRAAVASMAWSGYSMLLLACGAAALDCHADFWPEMHASPRRLEALILANGARVKRCFGADADGASSTAHTRTSSNWPAPAEARDRSTQTARGAALERVVAGRYEWRDGGLAPVRGARKRYWEDENEPVHRTQRPVQRRRTT